MHSLYTFTDVRSALKRPEGRDHNTRSLLRSRAPPRRAVPVAPPVAGRPPQWELAQCGQARGVPLRAAALP